MTYRQVLYDDNGAALAEILYAISGDDEAGSALTVLKVTPEAYEVSAEDEETLRERAGYDDALEAEREPDTLDAWEEGL